MMLSRTIVLLSAVTVSLTTDLALASEREVTVHVEGVVLHAVLTTPDGASRPPVALILAGSGPTDRDGNSAAGIHTDMYKKLAESLNAAGIATLRPDKRGAGRSTTTQPEASMTIGGLINDAATWIAWLNNPANDLGKVAVIGHSEGALVGLGAALKTPVAAYVSVAGAGENIADTLTRQLHSNPNNPPALLQEADQIIAALRAGQMVQQVSPSLMVLFRPSVQPYLISWMRLDPAIMLAQLQTPALIAQGEHDLQVTLQDAHKLSAAQPKAQLRLITEMNHVLVDAPTDPASNFATYSQPSLPLSTSFLAALTTFLKSTLW